MDTDKFGANPSGVALKFLYSGLSLKVDQMERKFKSSFKQLFYFVVQYLKATGQGDYDPSTAKAIFNRSTITNDIELNVVRDYIYYANCDDKYNLYRMKVDGSSKVKIKDTLCNYSRIIVRDSNNSIFFQDIKMHEIDINFNETTKLDNYMYFYNHHELYKIKINGTEKIKLYGGRVANINIVENWIYYTNADAGNRLYKMKTDGSERQIVE